MSAFNARLRLPGQSRIPLGVEVDVSDEQITLMTGEKKFAHWRLKDVDIEYLADGFHIKVDDEEMVLSVIEPSRFASELGVTASRPTPMAAKTDAAPKRRAGGLVEDLRRRASEVAATLTSESIPPQVAFAEWLGFLKELDSRHAHGSIPTTLFHELNGALLEMIPEPDAAVIS